MNRSGLTDSNLWLDAESAIDDSVVMMAQPYQLYIERRDASMNMARYYAMDISETLFGETRLTRRWGRIGARGQSKVHIFQREEEAVLLFLDLVRQKRTRGYREEFRAPAGVRKSPRKEPADPRLMLWRFRFSADACGGEPAARKWIDGYGKAALFCTRAALTARRPARRNPVDGVDPHGRMSVCRRRRDACG